MKSWFGQRRQHEILRLEQAAQHALGLERQLGATDAADQMDRELVGVHLHQGGVELFGHADADRILGDLEVQQPLRAPPCRASSPRAARGRRWTSMPRWRISSVNARCSWRACLTHRTSSNSRSWQLVGVRRAIASPGSMHDHLPKLADFRVDSRTSSCRFSPLSSPRRRGADPPV